MVSVTISNVTCHDLKGGKSRTGFYFPGSRGSSQLVPSNIRYLLCHAFTSANETFCLRICSHILSYIGECLLDRTRNWAIGISFRAASSFSRSFIPLVLPSSTTCCWVNGERAFNQGIESDSNRRSSTRKARALTTMPPRPIANMLQK